MAVAVRTLHGPNYCKDIGPSPWHACTSHISLSKWPLSLYLKCAGNTSGLVEHISRFTLLAARSQSVRKGKQRFRTAAVLTLPEELTIEPDSVARLPPAHKPRQVQLG